MLSPVISALEFVSRANTVTVAVACSVDRIIIASPRSN